MRFVLPAGEVAEEIEILSSDEVTFDRPTAGAFLVRICGGLRLEAPNNRSPQCRRP
jgi:hypothetical protein